MALYSSLIKNYIYHAMRRDLFPKGEVEVQQAGRAVDGHPYLTITITTYPPSQQDPEAPAPDTDNAKTAYEVELEGQFDEAEAELSALPRKKSGGDPCGGEEEQMVEELVEKCPPRIREWNWVAMSEDEYKRREEQEALALKQQQERRAQAKRAKEGKAGAVPAFVEAEVNQSFFSRSPQNPVTRVGTARGQGCSCQETRARWASNSVGKIRKGQGCSCQETWRGKGGASKARSSCNLAKEVVQWHVGRNQLPHPGRQG